MRDRDQVIEEMHAARADLSRDVAELRDQIEEKVQGVAELGERLDRVRDFVRARPWLTGVAFALGLAFGRR